MQNLWHNLRMFLWMSFITGIVYPLIIMGIAQLTMKHEADGSFVFVNGKAIGSSLIAQKFEDEKYFWPRPSAVNYNPLPSGGSNLGPTSGALKKIVSERKEKLLNVQGNTTDPIPSDLLYASGSGLDPHISPSAARYQIARIVKARGWNEERGKEELAKLIIQYTEKRRLGFLGKSCVNVLKINLALNELASDVNF